MFVSTESRKTWEFGDLRTEGQGWPDCGGRQDPKRAPQLAPRGKVGPERECPSPA